MLIQAVDLDSLQKRTKLFFQYGQYFFSRIKNLLVLYGSKKLDTDSSRKLFPWFAGQK